MALGITQFPLYKIKKPETLVTGSLVLRETNTFSVLFLNYFSAKNAFLIADYTKMVITIR